MSKEYKICPVCFGNGEIRQEERNPLKVIAEQKKIIRLIREDGEEAYKLIIGLLDTYVSKDGGISKEVIGVLQPIIDSYKYQHEILLKQLDDQEKK